MGFRSDNKVANKQARKKFNILQKEEDYIALKNKLDSNSIKRPIVMPKNATAYILTYDLIGVLQNTRNAVIDLVDHLGFERILFGVRLPNNTFVLFLEHNAGLDANVIGTLLDFWFRFLGVYKRRVLVVESDLDPYFLFNNA